MSVFGEVQAMQWRRAQHAENFAREMFEVITLDTEGAGQGVMVDPITFKGPFVRRPGVMYGSEIVSGVDPSVDGAVPLCSGSVFRFELSERGFFVGAYLAVRIDGPAAIKVRHTFTLLGMSYKEIGGDDQITPRSVDL